MSKEHDSAPPSQIVPSGVLKRLKPNEIFPSTNNPRVLFDPQPLKTLKDNIRQHGVLVPITVYQLKGQSKYHILDGERRHKCCAELKEEGIDLEIPANIVSPPNRVAGLLYMFSIHNFREPWELMPVALSLATVIDDLGESDTEKLSTLTGLSTPQVERCKKLLSYPKRFQELSLNPNPAERIPANLWIEAYPIFDIIKSALPFFYKKTGRDGVCDILVTKYRKRAIKSVIHFRRISEAYEETRADKQAEFNDALSAYLQEESLETRAAFDGFVLEARKITGTLSACDDFLKQVSRNKIEHLVDKDEVMNRLAEVKEFIDNLLIQLEGGDAPQVK